MSSHPHDPERQRRMCERKSRYPDKKAVQGIINRMEHQRGAEVRRVGIHAYPCPYCQGWHIAKGGKPGAPGVEREETRKQKLRSAKTSRRPQERPRWEKHRGHDWTAED